jgi:hypothetical protein
LLDVLQLQLMLLLLLLWLGLIGGEGTELKELNGDAVKGQLGSSTQVARIGSVDILSGYIRSIDNIVIATAGGSSS